LKDTEDSEQIYGINRTCILLNPLAAV